MTKINLKYNPEESLRPFQNKFFTKDMSNKEIKEELLLSSKIQEKTLINTLKIQKVILSWIQIFGFIFLANIILTIVLLFF